MNLIVIIIVLVLLFGGGGYYYGGVGFLPFPIGRRQTPRIPGRIPSEPVAT
jgi:hypothetical protein